jgi:hypothetical protein
MDTDMHRDNAIFILFISGAAASTFLYFDTMNQILGGRLLATCVENGVDSLGLQPTSPSSGIYFVKVNMHSDNLLFQRSEVHYT